MLISSLACLTRNKRWWRMPVRFHNYLLQSDTAAKLSSSWLSTPSLQRPDVGFLPGRLSWPARRSNAPLLVPTAALSSAPAPDAPPHVFSSDTSLGDSTRLDFPILHQVKKLLEESNVLNKSLRQAASLHQCRKKGADLEWNPPCTYVSVENYTRGPFHSCAKWRGQVGSASSIASQQWSTRLFVRSLSMKSRLNRKKRDLARREFQLLRRKTKLMKASMSPEEKLLWRLRKVNRKKSVLLQRLKKFELEEEPEPVHDPELITKEQLHALKKIGYKNRNYVPVGRRGVFGGVVLNMHMHWKFHETVQVDCHIYKRESVKEVAKKLAILSGGIVIDIHQATNIIMYRGRNYKQPKQEMTPPNTLTKRKALFQSKYLQALEALEHHTKEMEAELQKLRRQKKESIQVGEQSCDSELLHISESGNNKNSISEAGLSEVSTDDDGDFSWDSDSLDEDELSEEDEFNFKKAEEMHLQNKTTTSKPMSWTLEDSAQRRKFDARTASELVKAEQDLFKEGPKKAFMNGGRPKGAFKVGTMDPKLDLELKTDDDDEGLEHDSCVERERDAITNTKAHSTIGKVDDNKDNFEHDS